MRHLEANHTALVLLNFISTSILRHDFPHPTDKSTGHSVMVRLRSQRQNRIIYLSIRYHFAGTCKFFACCVPLQALASPLASQLVTKLMLVVSIDEANEATRLEISFSIEAGRTRMQVAADPCRDCTPIYKSDSSHFRRKVRCKKTSNNNAQKSPRKIAMSLLRAVVCPLHFFCASNFRKVAKNSLQEIKGGDSLGLPPTPTEWMSSHPKERSNQITAGPPTRANFSPRLTARVSKL